MTGLVVSAAISILVPCLVCALERYLRIRLETLARETLDSAMSNGVGWQIREGRAPTAAEAMAYVRWAASDAVAMWKLDNKNREQVETRAQADIQ